MIPAPCPFCGKKHPYGVEQEDNFDRYYVWCDGCDTTGPRAHTPTEAIKAWNRRAEVKGDARMIDNIEYVSFIEGLLFYIALRLGDKESLMMFLKTWGKEYEKHELEDLGGRDDA